MQLAMAGTGQGSCLSQGHHPQRAEANFPGAALSSVAKDPGACAFAAHLQVETGTIWMVPWRADRRYGSGRKSMHVAGHFTPSSCVQGAWRGPPQKWEPNSATHKTTPLPAADHPGSGRITPENTRRRKSEKHAESRPRPDKDRSYWIIGARSTPPPVRVHYAPSDRYFSARGRK
jgi:hypothetical protein